MSNAASIWSAAAARARCRRCRASGPRPGEQHRVLRIGQARARVGVEVHAVIVVVPRRRRAAQRLAAQSTFRYSTPKRKRWASSTFRPASTAAPAFGERTRLCGPSRSVNSTKSYWNDSVKGGIRAKREPGRNSVGHLEAHGFHAALLVRETFAAMRHLGRDRVGVIEARPLR